MAVNFIVHGPSGRATAAMKVNGTIYTPSRFGRMTVSAIADIPALVDLGCTLVPQDNYSAEAAPTADDDFDAGYYYGSRWFDGTTLYTCVDPTNGTAVWFAHGAAA